MSSQLTRPFLRNAAIGAATASYRALFYRWWDAFIIMAALGALCGILYTLLVPVFRNRPALRTVPYVLCFYLFIVGGLGVGVLKHDEMSANALTSPWGIGFILVAGAIGGLMAARTFERRSR